ncbi:MAG: DUF1844 domain-containing protein [Acidobacteriota bacterium]
MDNPEIKVTDRRMFTETGELREGVELEAEDSAEAAAAEPAAPAPEPAAAPASEPEPAPIPAAEAPPRRPAVDMGASGLPEAQFLDLVAVLAEPIALFLGDAALPDGQSAEDLDRARMYIDLLGVLQEKTAGNLSAEEHAIVDDLVYRLRLRYVEKKG